MSNANSNGNRSGRNRGQSAKGAKNGQNANGRGQSQGQGQKSGKRKSRSRSRSKRVDPRKYWGDRDLLVIPEEFQISSPDTSVVATSLGRPPIPGQENASKHYFSLVYDRAAMLAGALAAAGDIQNMAANAEQLARELEEADDDIDGNLAADDENRDDDDPDDGDLEDGDPGDPPEDDGNRATGTVDGNAADDEDQDEDEPDGNRADADDDVDGNVDVDGDGDGASVEADERAVASGSD